MLGTASPSWAEAKSTKLYVSTKGNDSWSGALPEPNLAKNDGPFASLEKARDAVRQLKAKGPLKTPVEILIRGGTYYLASALTLGPEDSGTRKCPVTYAAFPGEKPLLSGGRRITVWKKAEGALWTADVPGVKKGEWYLRQLFVNGKRRQRARLPDRGFFHIVAVAPESSKTAFQFKPGDIKPWKHLNDVEVIAFDAWNVSRQRIARVDEKAHMVTFSAARSYAFGRWDRHQRYYIENAVEGLDSPGEWYLDRSTGALTYWPLAHENLRKADVIAPALRQLVRFEGKIETQEKEYVRHITLRGLTFFHTSTEGFGGAWGSSRSGSVIMMEGVEHCAVEGCCVCDVGNAGIHLGRFSKHNRIGGNEITRAGGSGIIIFGGGFDPKDKETDETRFNTISNNHIHRCGFIHHDGVGINLVKASDNVISHNHIHGISYTGITIGSSSNPKKPLDARCKRNIIELNRIHDVILDLIDGGGIYTYGRCTGTTIRNNLIHDVYDHPR